MTVVSGFAFCVVLALFYDDERIRVLKWVSLIWQIYCWLCDCLDQTRIEQPTRISMLSPAIKYSVCVSVFGCWLLLAGFGIVGSGVGRGFEVVVGLAVGLKEGVVLWFLNSGFWSRRMAWCCGEGWNMIKFEMLFCAGVDIG